MVEIVAGGRYELAEGARWVDGRLVFVDIPAGRLYELTDDGARVLFELDVPLGAVAPVRDAPGTWIAAAGTGIALVDATGHLEWLARPEDDAPQPRRMNDAGCDPSGRFWAGSMAIDNARGAGSLYRVDHDGTVSRVADGFTIVNGPAFTPDGGRMYFADTFAGRIFTCKVDPSSGALLDRSDLVSVRFGDGMCVDTSGRLWSAIWGGSAVHCYRPDGVLERTIDLPARQPTSVCLADGALFVTTASVGLDDPGPHEGAVLRLPIDASAVPAAAFRLSR